MRLKESSGLCPQPAAPLDEHGAMTAAYWSAHCAMLLDRLESALAGEAAALEELAAFRDATLHLSCAEADARWQAKVERVRALRDKWAHQAVDYVWHELNAALAILDGEGEVST